MEKLNVEIELLSGEKFSYRSINSGDYCPAQFCLAIYLRDRKDISHPSSQDVYSWATIKKIRVEFI